MLHDEFIGQVRNRAQMSSRGEAEFATRAVLETLAERLYGGEPLHAASELPKGLAVHLQHAFAGSGTPYTLDEFIQVVRLREGVNLSEALNHTKAVIGVLKEALSEGEVRDIKSQLPLEFNPLFEINYSASQKIT